MANKAYDDTIHKDKPSFSASIPSKFIQNGFVQLFLPNYPAFDDVAYLSRKKHALKVVVKFSQSENGRIVLVDPKSIIIIPF